MPIILGLDLGTSKICALAYDTVRKRCLALRSAANGADVANLGPLRHEQKPTLIYETVWQLINDLCRDPHMAPPEGAGIGISGQMHGVLLVDKETLQPLTNLITWRDQRTLEEGTKGSLAEVKARCQSIAHPHTGCCLHAGYGGATLFWLAANEALPKEACALSLADYIATRLTGQLAIETTHAASWGILDIVKNEWQWEMIERLSLPKTLLPPLMASAAARATLRPEIAKAWGLPPAVRVCAPLGDNQASYFGAAGLDCKAAVLNLGTGGQLSVPITAYQEIEGMETRPLPFGGYLLVAASLCAGWSYAYLCRFFQEVCAEIGGVTLPEETIYKRLQTLAEKALPGSQGLEADTRFLGTRENSSARGSICGIDHRNFTPGNLARAFLEGMVKELARLVSGKNKINISRLIASGNAVRKNPLLLPIIADTFGVACEMSELAEEAALGAARAAAAGLGWY